MKFKFNNNDLQNYFLNKNIILSKDIIGFLEPYYPNYKIHQFRYIINKLRKNNLINYINKNSYSLNGKKNFSPILDKEMKKLYLKIKEKFPYTDFCIWNVSWINNYNLHFSNLNYYIIEIEYEATEVLFNYLQSFNNFTTIIY